MTSGPASGSDVSGQAAHGPAVPAQVVPAGTRAGIVIASSSAAAGTRPDQHAPLIEEQLRGLGFEVEPTLIVPDGKPVGEAIGRQLERGARLVLTSGGTGLTPDDTTPEQTAPLLERQIPGVMERIRAQGAEHFPLAALSRGLCGTVGSALVLNMPGSRGGIMDSLAVLEPLVAHILAQLENNHEH